MDLDFIYTPPTNKEPCNDLTQGCFLSERSETGRNKGKEQSAYQVVLQRVRPDVILDHFPQLVSSCIRVVGKPGKEALWLLVLPFLPSFVRRLACTLRQVLGREMCLVKI